VRSKVPAAVVLHLSWVKCGFSASVLTLAALEHKKSVLRAVLPSHCCELLSSSLKTCSRQIPLRGRGLRGGQEVQDQTLPESDSARA